ncbi:hypothetical protein SpCBS45565_g05073 [Spizellomyces sp. 'palustris']|nr:hypothetical protein SpCBS45565_g05073 [Spizellomyces sp. 'palustris']
MSLHPSTATIPAEANDPEGRRERSYKAAAHNQGNYPKGRLHAAEKFAELHERRTGEKVDPKLEAEIADEEFDPERPDIKNDEELKEILEE